MLAGGPPPAGIHFRKSTNMKSELLANENEQETNAHCAASNKLNMKNNHNYNNGNRSEVTRYEGIALVKPGLPSQVSGNSPHPQRDYRPGKTKTKSDAEFVVEAAKKVDSMLVRNFRAVERERSLHDEDLFRRQTSAH